MENQLTSVERVVEYSQLPDECSAVDGADAKTMLRAVSSELIGGTVWPRDGGGELEVSELQMRYDHDLPDVLNRITFSIKQGEKIGVVGRTGAGKSSLLAALLRLAPTSGTVKISGVDTRYAAPGCQPRMSALCEACEQS